jgi:hypothetical protein
MANITITWQAFGNKPERNRFVSSVTFETEFDITDSNRDDFFNVLYRNTNLYNGNLWNLIEPLLSPTRTHTALSIGDKIAVDGTAYLVADCGFIKEENADIKYFGESVFSISEKVGA